MKTWLIPFMVIIALILFLYLLIWAGKTMVLILPFMLVLLFIAFLFNKHLIVNNVLVVAIAFLCIANFCAYKKIEIVIGKQYIYGFTTESKRINNDEGGKYYFEESPS